MSTKKRKLKDSLGFVSISEGKLWGPSTQRAVENFPISKLRFSKEFYQVFAQIKKECASVNCDLKVLEPKKARAIEWACTQISQGKYLDQFPVDVFQTGSGTSTNMNFNEVISFLASSKAKTNIHPNDDVNLGQSSNDIFPTAIQVASCSLCEKELFPVLKSLEKTLRKKEDQFQAIIKVGRTHLQDAAPLTLGQEFSGYVTQIQNASKRIEESLLGMQELPLGGTAVGTGLNSPEGFGKRVAQKLSKTYGISFSEALNHFEAQSCLDRCLSFSSSLRGLAMSLFKVANDIRWMASGPRAGIGELILPAVQPGSSIMPGKINPVIPEALLQVCAKVIGNDCTVTWAVSSSQFQLNTMMPLVAYSLLESIEILSSGIDVFVTKCLIGIDANRSKINEHLQKNTMLVTSLASKIGYDEATRIAQNAIQKDQSIFEAAKEISKLSEAELLELLEPIKMLAPSKRR